MENGFISAELGGSKGRVNYSNSLCNVDVGFPSGNTSLPQGAK